MNSQIVPTASASDDARHAERRVCISPKLQAHHLDRRAVVYVRQSSPGQVRNNRESTALQYELTGRVLELGWQATQVEVIDEDQAHSAREADGRNGFQRLLSEVGLDQIGIIFGIEMSRLARSNKDWHHLLEVCGIFRTLLADQDGVYDPSDYNDRLLLGLKGTMSEAELHIMRGRMHQAKLHKARRGELFVLPPIGYVKGPSGGFELEPDEQAQSTVRLVFDQFDRLGSVRAVLRYLVQHDIRMPVRAIRGPAKGQLEWHVPRRDAVYRVLTHPIYAGYYRYGYRQADPRRRRPGQPGSGKVVVPEEQWHALIADRCPAYISRERFAVNQQRLKENRSRAEYRGAPREGPSQLAGLIVCGRCGRRMTVHYAGRAGHLRYVCVYAKATFAGPPCQSFAGRVLDEFVASRVLAALEPAALELSLQAAADVRLERGRLHEHWRQRLERARYEATRAERQYQAVEPENRLVARELERRWEESLGGLRQQECEYAQFCQTQPAELTTEERQRILALAQDLPQLWSANQTTHVDRQSIVRQLIDRVVVHVQERSERVDVSLVWAGGFVSQHELVRPVLGYQRMADHDRLVERIEELRRQGLTFTEIGEHLNLEGFRPAGAAKKFHNDIVSRMFRKLRQQRQSAREIAKRELLDENEWFALSLASRLKMPKNTLLEWVRRGWVHVARQLPGYRGRKICWADADEINRLARLRDSKRGWWDPLLPAELTTPKTPAADGCEGPPKR